MCFFSKMNYALEEERQVDYLALLSNCYFKLVDPMIYLKFVQKFAMTGPMKMYLMGALTTTKLQLLWT